MSQINFIHRQKTMARAENRPHGLALVSHGVFEDVWMPFDVMHETFASGHQSLLPLHEAFKPAHDKGFNAHGAFCPAHGLF